MKKISKIIVLVIMLTLIVCVSTRVWADNEPIDLSNSLTGGNNTTTNETTDNNTTTNETTGNNTTDNNTTNNETIENTTTNNNTTNNTVPDISPNTNNTSQYEENKIPHAGVEDTILMGTAFVVFAVIGIYTFIKLSEYSNI